MDLDLTEEQTLFRDSVRGFAERHLAEGARERARAEGYPWDVARLMAAQGLLGIAFPEEDGGQGGTLLDAVIAIQEIARVCPRSGDVVQAGNFGPIRTLFEYATDDQKARFLAPLLRGEAVIALGMSEPEAGSAVTDLKTAATPDGDGYRISGTKVFSTNGPEAAVFLVYVRFGAGVGGIGSVLIEPGQEGFSLGQPVRFMNGDTWRQLYFDDVYVPPENILLGPGGFKKQIAAFNVERIGNATRSIAVARLAFETARAYALERHQFGRPLCEFQGIQWKFADMAIKLEAAELMVHRLARDASERLPGAYDTAVVKAFCNQSGFEIANEAMQVMGASGYSEDSLVEYCVRRCRGWMIAGGSMEMLRNRIAEGVFDRRFSQRPERARD